MKYKITLKCEALGNRSCQEAFVKVGVEKGEDVSDAFMHDMKNTVIGHYAQFHADLMQKIMTASDQDWKEMIKDKSTSEEDHQH